MPVTKYSEMRFPTCISALVIKKKKIKLKINNYSKFSFGLGPTAVLSSCASPLLRVGVGGGAVILAYKGWGPTYIASSTQNTRHWVYRLLLGIFSAVNQG
jgi:hypothetical protein